MARWAFNVVTFTPATGQADATPLTSPGFCALIPGTSTQYIKVYEMEEQGQTSSAAGSNFMVWARDSTNAATPAGLASPNSIGPMDVNTAALAAPAVGMTAATTGPSRATSTSLAKLNMSFNPFGGILRWQAAPGCEWGQLGTATSVGESSLSNFTGGATGAQSFKVLFEIL